MRYANKNFQMMLARQKKGLYQKELAEMVGTKENYISKIENNIDKPSLKMAQKIAAALDSTVDELFGDAGK